MEAWRNVLLGKKKNVGVYTVHAMLVPSDGENGPWEAVLGGQVAYIDGLVLTRTGPLLIFGLLGKDGFTSLEAKQWSETEVPKLGGRIKVVRKSDNYWAITPALCQALNSTGRWCFDRTQQFHNQSNASSS
jgi:hypothetical protein